MPDKRLDAAHRTATALSLFTMLCLAAGAAQGDQANIVILFADDLGYGSVSSYGSDIPTPHIDSIGRNGIRFTSGYMTAPVCNPSRNGLMTGRYQQRWGKELNSGVNPPIGAARGTLGIGHTTIANALKKVGYANAAIGKWQLGMRELLHPLDRGFDYFVGMSAGMNYLDPKWPGAHYLSVDEPKISQGGIPGIAGLRENPDRALGLYRGREIVPLEEYLTDHLGNEGVGFIERNKDRPFFLYLAFNAPHGPMQVTDEYYQRFPQHENETRRIYAGMVSALDDAVGAVLAKLRKEGLEEKTLVIFASDNGATEGNDVERVHNRPLIGHKRNLYDGGTRVPYLMQWKDRIPEGQVYRHPVSSLDFFATALALAGEDDAAQYRLDGVNLIPYLTGEKQGAPHEYLYWRSGPNAAVRHGEWKLLMIGSDLERLYNVERDPGESKDMAAKHPDLVTKMKKAFDRWGEEMAPKQPTGVRSVETDYNGDHITWFI